MFGWYIWFGILFVGSFFFFFLSSYWDQALHEIGWFIGLFLVGFSKSLSILFIIFLSFYFHWSFFRFLFFKTLKDIRTPLGIFKPKSLTCSLCFWKTRNLFSKWKLIKKPAIENNCSPDSKSGSSIFGCTFPCLSRYAYKGNKICLTPNHWWIYIRNCPGRDSSLWLSISLFIKNKAHGRKTQWDIFKPH